MIRPDSAERRPMPVFSSALFTDLYELTMLHAYFEDGMRDRAVFSRLRERVPVELLLTDVISHADTDRPANLSDVLRLAHFWGDLLAR